MAKKKQKVAKALLHYLSRSTSNETDSISKKIMQRTTDHINAYDNKLNSIGKSSLFVYSISKGMLDGIRGARGRISPLVHFGWWHVEYSNFSPNGSFLFRACDTLERRFEGSASVNDSHSNTSPSTQRCPPLGHPRSVPRVPRFENSSRDGEGIVWRKKMCVSVYSAKNVLLELLGMIRLDVYHKSYVRSVGFPKRKLH